MDLSVKDPLKFNPHQAIGYEWLETNGLGGFASSTIIGMNTRRYHGLLTTTLEGMADRYVLLSKMEEDLIINDQRFYLSTNQYDEVFHPPGYQYLIKFALDPFPTFTYQVQGLTLQKIVFMVHGQNTVVVQYKILKDEAQGRFVRLELRPLTAFRDYHQTGQENASLNPAVQIHEGEIIFKPYAHLPQIFLAHNAADVRPQGQWYNRFFYSIEEQRGLDAHEDLFNPCVFTFDLSKGDASIMASLQTNDISLAPVLKDKEINRRAKLGAAAPENAFKQQLVLAADQFIVEQAGRQTVIAGYHWFSDWGRDTMIALPGLTLATGRFDDAKSILLAFATFVDQGMLPNRFVAAGEKPEYNTVDAALWFVEAVRQYGAYTGQWDFINGHFYPVLQSIIDWYMKGTRYNIHMDEDGLITCGQDGVQLTWMDAKIGDWVVTPRRGKPVEIQALWYNALCVMQGMAQRYQDIKSAESYQKLSQKVKTNFNRAFWNESQACLYDVINADGADAAIRPNQLFALSLHHPVLDEDKFLKVLQVVEKELLTPLGLRSLSAGHPDYKKIYTGSPLSRDAAYHQGTVWLWLIGPFISASVRTYGSNQQSLDKVKALLEPFKQHLKVAGIGQISEICDGDSPHTPRGCIAQAWSVAELLRVMDDAFTAGK